MRDGELSALRPWVPTISANESGYLPTPMASDSDGQARPYDGRRGMMLKDFFGKNSASWLRRNGGTRQRLPTPQFNDYKSGSGYDHDGKTQAPQLRHLSGGLLNPEFHCWMMGWPVRWTSLQPMNEEPHDPALDRVQRIKCSGNGQVPLAMATAWRVLISTEG